MTLCNSRFVSCIIIACLASAFQHGYYASVMNIPNLLIKTKLVFNSYRFWESDSTNKPPEHRVHDPYLEPDWYMTTKHHQDYWESGNNRTRFKQRPLQKEYDKALTTAKLKEVRTILWPVVVAMFPLGAMLGSAFTVLIANSRLGRLSIIYCTLFSTAFGIILLNIFIVAPHAAVLIIARLIIGLSLGICAGICPIYLVEISNIATRGAVLTAYQLFIVMSIVYGQIISYSAISAAYFWSLCIGMGTFFFIFILFFVVKFCPESPTYILINEINREHKAKANLAMLRDSSNVDQEFDEIKKEDRLVKENPATLSDIPKGPFLLCFVVVIAEQLCGINIFIYYSTEIFVDARVLDPITCTVGTMFIMLLGTIVSIRLVEKVGRRTLLLVSLGGLSIVAMVLTPALVYSVDNDVQDFCVVFIFLYALFYSIGLGPARWMIIMELFGYSARPLVVSMIHPVNFFLDFIIAMTFGALQVESRYYLFILFVICNVAAFCFVFLYMPETKGKKQDEIEVSLKNPVGLKENTKEVTTTPSNSAV